MNAFLGLLVVGLLASFGLGLYLTRPHPQSVGPPPEHLQLTSLTLNSTDGLTLSAWYRPPVEQRPMVLLLHGIGADRRSMLGRAEWFMSMGYGVFLLDLRAHGESQGYRVSLGWDEARDVEAAVDWIKGRHDQSALVIVGYSLGGAATLLGEAARQADALVLEAVFPDLPTAVSNRLRDYLGEPAVTLAPLLLIQTRIWPGVAATQINPAQGLSGLSTPVLVIGGDSDPKTPPGDLNKLVVQHGGEHEIWVLEGAEHEDFLAFAPERYRQKVSGFLKNKLTKSH